MAATGPRTGVLDISDRATAETMRQYLLGDWDNAAAGFQGLIDRDPANHFLPFLLGETEYARGDLQRAVDWYHKAIELKPDYGVAYYKLGVSYYRMGLLKQSLESFAKLLGMEEQSHAMASYFYGLINQFLGNDGEAERGFAMLHKESRQSVIANYYLALLKIKHHQYDEALRLLEELLAATPDLPEVHYLMGVAFKGLHRNTEAIREFRRTLEINPQDDRARASLELLTDTPAP
jgi:tetratricopeptide (TPR) repeat protein